MLREAASTSPRAEYGEVYTREFIVELILDLAGYTPDRDLVGLRAVEPSCGAGAFLVPMLTRLLDSAAKHDHAPRALTGALVAFDLLPSSVAVSRRRCVELLEGRGWSAPAARRWARNHVLSADFILAPHQCESLDFVIGNPPYVRLEEVDPELSLAYRNACPTMGGRADIFVGFWETALRLLRDEGRVAFICADRWMRNAYGKGLRRLVLEDFAVDAVISMHDVDAFEEPVSAYPAVTVLRRGRQGPALVADTTPAFGAESAALLSGWATSGEAQAHAGMAGPGWDAAVLPRWFRTDDHWPSGSPERLEWLEELNEKFPLLEESGPHTRLGIGVATGADKVYITTDTEVVESDRLLPLAMAADLKTGEFCWTGHFLVNPWSDNELVDLADYPRLASYFERHAAALQRRNVAKRSPTWYRTIDRVNHPLTAQPKLLLEDMKAHIHPVLEPGAHYPHHNLYWITSNDWDLEVLGGLLLSDAVEAQVSAYCVKMRGGTLRFQAQYLRRVRVPRPLDIEDEVAAELRRAFKSRDRVAASSAALVAFGLDSLP